MSITPSSLLARLEELRKWQEKQQERLLQQQLLRANTSNASSNYDSIEGLSAFNSSTEIVNNDLKQRNRSVLTEKDVNVISSKKKSPVADTFEPQNVFAKPKRPYLKRGSGLVRFKMNPGDQTRPFNKVIPRKSNLKNGDTKCNEIISKDDNITPLKRPDINIQAVWCKVGCENEDIINEGDERYDSDTLAKKTILQINELAAQTFDAPAKPISMVNKDLIVQNKIPLQEISANTVLMTDSLCENIESVPIKKVPTEQSIYEKALERELLIFEALEEKAMNSSFCSTSSSILRILSSTPSKLKDKSVERDVIQENIEEANSIAEEIKNNAANDVEYTNTHENFEIDSNTDKINSLESSVTSEDFHGTHEEKLDFKDDAPWSDINTYTRENSSLSSESVASNKNSEQEVTLTSTTEHIEKKNCEIPDDEAQDILAKKLMELDDEIQNFRKENAKLQRAKLELEKQQREFKKEKKAFEKFVLEEKINVEFYLEDEKKKLTKEKMVFERYVKEVQNKTTRKEREEISSLKEELANLKETCKLKDTRNATSQARLRNQIKSFEKEVVSLKEELEKLRKQNAKLTMSQKLSRKSTDAKMLQEINKNLSKLTKDVKVSEQLKKVENSIEKKKNLVDMLDTEDDVMKEKEERNELIDSFYGKNKINSKHDFEEKAEVHSYRNYEDFLKNDSIVEKNNDKERVDCATNTQVRIQNDNLSTDVSLERNYERIFGINNVDEPQSNLNDVPPNKDDKRLQDKVLPDGTKEISYPNGNVKKVSPDGNYICLKYFNGDIKETKLLEGTIRYYYAENQSWQTTTADGTEILEFPNGQIEKKFKDGTTEITFPNGIHRITKPDGSETISYPDKTKVDIDSSGGKVISLPNGQKEIHNSEHMRREYPDGTVKIVYPDGIQETRYSNGRIRIKDKVGNLLLDSHDDT